MSLWVADALCRSVFDWLTGATWVAAAVAEAERASFA